MRIRRCGLEDAEALARLMTATSERFLADELSEQGRAHLLADLLPGAVEARMRKGALHLCAEEPDGIVGVIVMTDGSHVYQLFVDGRHHRRGIARALWTRARKECTDRDGTREFTVNASRYAVPAYERLGFCACSEPVTRNGVTCVPMRFLVESEENP